MAQRDIEVHITSGTILKTLLFLAGAALLWYLRDIVLIVLAAIVIASAVEPGIHALMRYRVPRLLAVIVLYLGVAAVFFAIGFFFVPPILNDAAGFLQALPATLTSFNISDATHGLVPLGSVVQTFSSVSFLHNLSYALGGDPGSAITTLTGIFGGVASFVLIIVFAFYFSVQETGVDDFLRVVTPVSHQAYVLGLWKRSQQKIGKWMQGQLVLGLVVGVLLFLGLTILGVPYALLLAVTAGVFELIPAFGQILAAIPAVILGATSGGITEALLVAGLYLVVQQFEANLIYPVVVKKIVGIPPLLVILALIVGFKLVGFLGVLLAVPIAGAIQEVVADLDRSRGELARARDAE